MGLLVVNVDIIVKNKWFTSIKNSCELAGFEERLEKTSAWLRFTSEKV